MGLNLIQTLLLICRKGIKEGKYKAETFLD